MGGMSEDSENPLKTIQAELADLVRRELLQIGELRDVEERLKIVVERASKITPTPEAD